MARTFDPNSKSGFIRSQPAAMSAADVVKAAKAKGIKIDTSLVYAVRGAKKAKTRAAAKSPTATVVSALSHEIGRGLAAEIERIVEARVNAILKAKLGALLG